ncbi:MAG: hypothetical protein IK139_07825 [Lachnospiraceae bacterium]|nr:hypothetical protein [Lachnospiraceae bacterium]
MDTNKQFMVTAGSSAPPALDYDILKTQLKIELTEQVNGFVRIGYLLKQARDTDILQGSIYKDVMDFASKEFHLTKDVVSRYINICEKYSEGGNSDKLLSEYSEYGYSKLSEMLTLPEEIAEEITPETTRREIQEIKREYQEEQKITPLETMVEEPVKIPEEIKEQAYGLGIEHFDTPLGKTLYLLCAANRQLFDSLLAAAQKAEKANGEDEDYENRVNKWALEAIAPNGQANMTVRVPQAGKIMVSVKEDIRLTNMRSLEKETHSGYEVLQVFEDMVMAAGGLDRDPEELCKALFAEVAPVQPQSEDPKPEEKVTEIAEKTEKPSENNEKPSKNEEKTSKTPEKTSAPDEKTEEKGPDTAAAGDGFMNAPEDPEPEVIPETETEIVEKEPEVTKDPFDEIMERLDEPNMPVEDLERLVNAMIRSNTMRFSDDDPRKRPAERIPFLIHSLIYHIRQWKWMVVADIAKNIAEAASQTEKAEKEMFEEEK